MRSRATSAGWGCGIAIADRVRRVVDCSTSGESYRAELRYLESNDSCDKPAASQQWIKAWRDATSGVTAARTQSAYRLFCLRADAGPIARHPDAVGSMFAAAPSTSYSLSSNGCPAYAVHSELSYWRGADVEIGSAGAV